MTLPDPADIPFSHGGRRTPGPGKKLGRKPKPAGKKAFYMSITLSCKAAADTLKRKSKDKGITPGALVERTLKLSPAKRSTRAFPSTSQ